MSKSNGNRSREHVTSKTSDVISDPRFANIQSDPRFRLPSKRNTRVQIDRRFAPILEDEAFSSSAKVDRYGRKLPKEKLKQDLQRFYRIEDDAPDIDDEAVTSELRRIDAGDETSSEDEESATESSDSSSEDNEDQDPDEETFGVTEGNDNQDGAIPRGEVSPRLAVVNLDWDNIRAPDLMAVFQSFIPTAGQILKVAVYPSEFGKERMEREETEGPPLEIFARTSGEVNTNNSEDSDGDSGSDDAEDDDDQVKQSLLKEDAGAEFSSSHLRRYQLSRLRYYYAVITCSSNSAASAIYDTVDGTEYLTTANFFDLRFIPDEMSFENDIPRDECTTLPDGYRPNDFVTEALQHSKVKLTWDADDGARKEVQKRAFGGSRKDIDENDLKAYLGSESSDDDADDRNNAAASETPNFLSNSATVQSNRNLTSHSNKKEAERQRKRALLGLPTSQEPHLPKSSKETPLGDMEVTFTSGLSAPATGSNYSVFENSPLDPHETTAEKYMRKEKERKAKRREKMKANRTAAAGGGGDETADGTAIEHQPPGTGENPTTTTTTQRHNNADNQENKDQPDLGFNDPFFTTPTPTTTTASPPTKPSLTKAARREKRLSRPAAEPASTPDHSNLERLTTSDPIKHFNTASLLRAEKLLAKSQRRKGKKFKLSARDKDALAAAAQDDFEMDVKDERFRSVFERAEFAIDPSHPRFSGSGGMRRLVEEGRKGRKRGREEGEERAEKGGDGVGELVERVKRRVAGGQ